MKNGPKISKDESMQKISSFNKIDKENNLKDAVNH